jgi:DNA-binding NarL/FixJ family response regulator
VQIDRHRLGTGKVPNGTEAAVVTGRTTVKLFIVDHHSIYRQGMATCLEAAAGVEFVAHCDTPADAWNHPRLREVDLVIVDPTGAETLTFIRQVHDRMQVPVLACSPLCGEHDVLAVVEAGAIGMLAKDSLAPDALAAGVDAALAGSGVMPAAVLTQLLHGLTRVSREVLEPRGLSLSRLTDREREVLRLISQGHATREVARELSYSERTVKNVVHDVVTKLGARSRSHAIAHAVREGLI